jgi:hypothetical protein
MFRWGVFCTSPKTSLEKRAALSQRLFLFSPRDDGPVFVTARLGFSRVDEDPAFRWNVQIRTFFGDEDLTHVDKHPVARVREPGRGQVHLPECRTFNVHAAEGVDHGGVREFQASHKKTPPKFVQTDFVYTIQRFRMSDSLH